LCPWCRVSTRREQELWTFSPGLNNKGSIG
jgi:hypothetical protein